MAEPKKVPLPAAPENRQPEEPLYYVIEGNEAAGPYRSRQIAIWLGSGKISGDDPILPEGGTNWITAAEVAEPLGLSSLPWAEPDGSYTVRKKGGNEITYTGEALMGTWSWTSQVEIRKDGDDLWYPADPAVRAIRAAYLARSEGAATARASAAGPADGFGAWNAVVGLIAIVGWGWMAAVAEGVVATAACIAGLIYAYAVHLLWAGAVLAGVRNEQAAAQR